MIIHTQKNKTMKKIAMLMFFSCMMISIAQGTNIEVGNFLNVSAESGLKMRSAPGMDGRLLQVIPFGETVKVVSTNSEINEQIEWVEGNWIEVEYEGVSGYVFDGFLNKLATPSYDFEFTVDDLDLIYPLMAWTEYRYTDTKAPDTIFQGTVTKLIQPMTEGTVLKKFDDPYLFKVEVELEDIRIMDAYQLLHSMCSQKYEKQSYKNNSIFINDNYGQVERIQVNIDHPVEIKKLKNGKVRITVKSYNQGCSL